MSVGITADTGHRASGWTQASLAGHWSPSWALGAGAGGAGPTEGRGAGSAWTTSVELATCGPGPCSRQIGQGVGTARRGREMLKHTATGGACRGAQACAPGEGCAAEEGSAHARAALGRVLCS